MKKYTKQQLFDMLASVSNLAGLGFAETFNRLKDPKCADIKSELHGVVGAMAIVMGPMDEFARQLSPENTEVFDAMARLRRDVSLFNDKGEKGVH